MLPSPADVGKMRSQAVWALNKMRVVGDDCELAWIEAVVHLTKAVEWLEDYQSCRRYDDRAPEPTELESIGGIS